MILFSKKPEGKVSDRLDYHNQEPVTTKYCRGNSTTFPNRRNKLRERALPSAVSISRFSPCGLRFSPRGLRFSLWGLRLRGLRFSQRGRRFSPWGLRFSPWGLRFSP